MQKYRRKLWKEINIAYIYNGSRWNFFFQTSSLLSRTILPYLAWTLFTLSPIQSQSQEKLTKKQSTLPSVYYSSSGTNNDLIPNTNHYKCYYMDYLPHQNYHIHQQILSNTPPSKHMAHLTHTCQKSLDCVPYLIFETFPL